MIEVSVIIPVYNVGKYIEKTLNSIVNQVFDNFEIIIIDDGSTDNTKEEAEKILKASKRRYKIISQQNSGVSSARNRGILESKGKYIYFIDGDDWAEPDLLKKLYRKIKETNADFVFCGYDHVLEDGSSNDSGKFNKYLYEEVDGITASRLMLEEKIWIWINSGIYKRENIDNIEFNKKYKYNEDVLFTLTYLLKCKKIVSVNEELVHYLKRKGSAINTANENYVHLVYSLIDYLNITKKLDGTEEVIEALEKIKIPEEVLRVFSYLSRSKFDKTFIINFIEDEKINKYINKYKIRSGYLKRYIFIKLINVAPYTMYKIYGRVGVKK